METNTRILSSEFEYFEPKSVEETLDLLSRYGEKARLIAGGTDLLVKMKRELLHPEILISLSRVSELNFISEDEGSFRIGAATTLFQLEKNPSIGRTLSALYEAVRSMAAPAIRNMGTIGGNLANGSPAADTAPPLQAFGSFLKLKSKDGERTLPLGEFLLGPGKTALSYEEMISEIVVPKPPVNSGSAFLKLGRVSFDMAKINVAVYLEREGRRCSLCRISLGSVAPTPIRAFSAEKLAQGEIFGESLIKAVSLKCQEEIKPIDDVRSTLKYRKAVCPVMVEEALKAAWERCGSSL